MERVEHGDAILTADHRLAVQGERSCPQLRSDTGDPGVAFGPVMGASGEQAHSLAVPADDQPVAVMLDLMHPVGPAGGLAARVGKQGSMKPSVRRASIRVK